MLGVALRKQGEPVAAAQALTAALKREPSNGLLWQQLAGSLMSAGQVDEACDAAHAAVLYEPLEVGALEVSARCELERGNAEKALALVAKARERAPHDERLRRAEDKLKAEVATPKLKAKAR